MPTMICGLELAIRPVVETSMSAQSDLAEEEWAAIAPLLPSERGRNCRPAHDNRQFLNGMLWVACTGASWRDMPSEYGKWNSVYQRFRRWSQIGVCDTVAKAFARLAAAQVKRRATDRTGVQARLRAAAWQGMVRDHRRTPQFAVFPAPMPSSRRQKSQPRPGRSRSTAKKRATP
jgi:transposase